MLKMGEHRAPQVEYHLFPGDGDHPVLEPGRGVVDDDHGGEYRDRSRQPGQVPLIAEERAVDAVADHQRDRQLGAGGDQDGRDGEKHATAIRPDIGDETPHDRAVEEGAEHLLVAADLGADDGARRPLAMLSLMRIADRPGHGATAPPEAPAGSGSPSCRDCSAYSAA